MTCPHPEKVKHANRADALAAIRSLYKAGRGNPDLVTYRCGDHFHVGHNAQHFRRRIKQALRKTPRRTR